MIASLTVLKQTTPNLKNGLFAKLLKGEKHMFNTPMVLFKLFYF